MTAGDTAFALEALKGQRVNRSADLQVGIWHCGAGLHAHTSGCS